LSGYSPFFGEDTDNTIKKVIKCRWNFNVFEFELVSIEAKDFISKLLIKSDRYVYDLWRSGFQISVLVMFVCWLNGVRSVWKKFSPFVFSGKNAQVCCWLKNEQAF